MSRLRSVGVRPSTVHVVHGAVADVVGSVRDRGGHKFVFPKYSWPYVSLWGRIRDCVPQGGAYKRKPPDKFGREGFIPFGSGLEVGANWPLHSRLGPYIHGLAPTFRLKGKQKGGRRDKHAGKEVQEKLKQAT